MSEPAAACRAALPCWPGCARGCPSCTASVRASSTTCATTTAGASPPTCGAGITVGIVALPLAMAFAIASGLKPEQGIFTAIIAGFLISALGGSSVQIGGPAGAFIVIVYGIVQRYGVANLLIATVLAGILLLALGGLKLGALVRYIPISIVIGFTNGIAVLIALSQVKELLGLRVGPVGADFFAQAQAIRTHIDNFNPYALGLGLASFFGLLFWARMAAFARPDGRRRRGHRVPCCRARSGTRRAIRIATRVPGPIVALVTLSLLATFAHLPVETIGERFGSIPKALPAFVWPVFDWAHVQRPVRADGDDRTARRGRVAAVRPLLTACPRRLRRHDPNQELMAQGIANIVTPFFGGIPATGTIARTVTNLRAGATSPVAGIVHAVTLLAIVLLAAPLAASVPLPVLAGVLLFVAWNMSEWHEFARLSAFSLENRIKLVAAFLLTVMVDLTVAMEVGLAAACVVFVYRMSTLFRVEREPAATHGLSDVAVVRLYGPLFFAAVAKLEALVDELPPETTALVLDAHQLVSIDSSGLSAFENMHRSLVRKGIRLVVAGLDEQPHGQAPHRWGLDSVTAARQSGAGPPQVAFAALAAESANSPRHTPAG